MNNNTDNNLDYDVNMKKAKHKMTLEEAIQHCYEVSKCADNCDCSKEHLQLAEWLEELQERRSMSQECEVVDRKQNQ